MSSAFAKEIISDNEKQRTRDASHLDSPVRPRFAQLLIHPQRSRHLLLRLALGQERAEDRGVLAGLGGALSDVRQGGVSGVGEEDRVAVDPAGEGEVNPQCPFDEFARRG